MGNTLYPSLSGQTPVRFGVERASAPGKVPCTIHGALAYAQAHHPGYKSARNHFTKVIHWYRELTLPMRLYQVHSLDQ
jgi:hypothetical protein